MPGELIEQLRKIQAVDAELFRYRNEQQQKPLELEASKQRVAEQQANAQVVEAKLKTLQLQQKEKDIELSTRETNVQKLQGQLAQVKTNKEYTAMQHEIDQSKADASVLEESIIKLIDQIELATKEHKDHQARIAEAQAAFKQEEARVKQELSVIEQRIAEQEVIRQTLTPAVDPDALNTYERILSRSRQGMVMAPLLSHSCGGCQMQQRPQIINQVHLAAKLVTCESCNRILYLEPSDSAASTAA